MSPAPDLSRLDSPLGPPRDKRIITIATDDFVLKTGFICQVNSAGNITYQTMEGDGNQTESNLAAGDIIAVCGVPVVLQAVRGSSTVTSILIGVL